MSHKQLMMALKTRALRLKQLKSHTPVEVNDEQVLLHCMRKALSSSGNTMMRNPVGKVILEQVLHTIKFVGRTKVISANHRSAGTTTDCASKLQKCQRTKFTSAIFECVTKQ